MMKIMSYVFAVSVVCACLWGCTDKSYRGMYDTFNVAYKSSNLPVVVRIGESVDIGAKSATKGVGTIGNAHQLAGKDFHIYAFRKDYTNPDEPEFNWIADYTITSAEDKYGTLLDATLDDPASPAGRTASWNAAADQVEWPDKSTVYWPEHSEMDYTYDFFAYYVDDMPLTADDYHRTKDEVNIDIRLTDGRQDIMSSKAVPSDMQLDVLFGSQEKFIYKYYWCYGHQAARMNLQPEFIFKHHLSKVRFCVVPGVTEGYVNQVTIHNLKVTSKNKGVFRVACKEGEPGIKFNSKEVQDFELKEEDGSPLNEYVIQTLSEDNGSKESKDIGSYLLLAPSANGYTVRIEMSEIRDLGGENEEHRQPGYFSTFVYKGNQDSPDPFEPGSEYVVTLYVYGREDVRMSIKVNKWEEGGYIIPDTEDIPD